MAYNFAAGTTVDGTLLEDSGLIVTDNNGTAHGVMSAILHSVIPHPTYGRVGVCEHVRIGFPTGSSCPMPFVETHFSGTIGGALNYKKPRFAFRARTILTIDNMKTDTIGSDHYELLELDTSDFSVVASFLGRPTGVPRRDAVWHFAGPNPSDVLARWKQEGYRTLERNPDGIKVRLTSDSTLHFHGTGTTFSGNLDNRHLAARVAVEYLRDRHDGVITINGETESYKMSLWAHAQLMRVLVTDYEPPEHLRDEASGLVERLRAEYAQAGTVLLPYRPPSKISGVNQMYYAMNRPKRFICLKS